MCTLNLHVDDVVVVLDALLNLTAVNSWVGGPQLRDLDASVCGSHGVANQMNPVQVALADTHLSFQGYEDGCDFFFGDEAPFDTMKQGGDGGSSWVWDGVVLHEKQKHHSLPICFLS